MAVIGTGVIVLLLARTLWPRRPLVWLAATAFFAFLPTVLKAGAMFHPEPLGMLLTAGALLVLARMVRGRRYSWWLAVSARSSCSGLGQLVRAWSLWMVAVAVLVLVVVALTDRWHPPARTRLARGRRSLVAAVVPAPWYAYQATRYSNPVFNRPQPDAFLLARRPLEFYVDARVPDDRAQSVVGPFNDRFWPVLYAETLGRLLRYLVVGPGPRRAERMRSTPRSPGRARSASFRRRSRSREWSLFSGSR